MKAKFVFESINFERGGDPKKNLGVGIKGIAKSLGISERSPNALFKAGVENNHLILIKTAMKKASGYDIDSPISGMVNRYNNHGNKTPYVSTKIKGIGNLYNKEIDQAIELAYEKNDLELINLFWEKTDLFVVEYLIEYNKQDDLIDIIKNRKYDSGWMYQLLINNHFPNVDLLKPFKIFYELHPVKFKVEEKFKHYKVFWIDIDKKEYFGGTYDSMEWYKWNIQNPDIAWWICKDNISIFKNKENFNLISYFIPNLIINKIQKSLRDHEDYSMKEWFEDIMSFDSLRQKGELFGEKISEILLNLGLKIEFSERNNNFLVNKKPAGFQIESRISEGCELIFYPDKDMNVYGILELLELGKDLLQLGIWRPVIKDTLIGNLSDLSIFKKDLMRFMEKVKNFSNKKKIKHL